MELTGLDPSYEGPSKPYSGRLFREAGASVARASCTRMARS